MNNTLFKIILSTLGGFITGLLSIVFVLAGFYVTYLENKTYAFLFLISGICGSLLFFYILAYLGILIFF